jgi:hypothetical protein
LLFTRLLFVPNTVLFPNITLFLTNTITIPRFARNDAYDVICQEKK